MRHNASYNDFAYVYDLLTDDVEYEKRADYIDELISKHFKGKAELLCDLGCGTGSMCVLFDKKGYDCIGVDNSEAMLNIAFQKREGTNILFLNQSICEFELFGTVDVFLSTLDTVNYITESQDVYNMFSLVNNYLNPDGLFIFDVNTLYKFENILGNNTFVFEKDDVFYTWENFYEDEMLDFYLNFFIKDSSGNYSRFSEQHCQKYHSHEFLIDCAQKNGLSFEGCYADMTMCETDCNTERAFYVFKKTN